MTIYKLADAHALHAEHFRTFYIPTPAQVMSLVPGNLAKLIFHPAEGVEGMPERMWVEVTAGADADGQLEGTLANQPATLPLRHGETIRFAVHNVIETAEDYPQ